MKLIDRIVVEGTVPPIYIGHKEFRDKKTGKMKSCRRWHAEFNFNGKKFDESLRTANKAEAIRVAHKIVQRLERGEVKQVHLRVEWQQLRDDYISFVKSKRRAPKTITKYSETLECFIAFAKTRNRARPDQITPADYWAFNAQLATDGLADGTIEDKLIILKQVYKWGTTKAKPRLLAVNPIADEDVPEAEDAPQPCFTPEQVATLIKEADDHHRPIWSIMAHLGLRFGEVRDLRWSDFDFTQGTNGWVNIQRGGSGTRTKSKKSRRIPLNPELRTILLGLSHHEDGLVFHQQASKKYPSGGRPLNPDRLLKSLKRLCKRCDFENPTQFKQHSFRHTFASMLARQNVPYRQALSWMGHQNSQILDLYIKLFDKDAERHISGITYSSDTAA